MAWTSRTDRFQGGMAKSMSMPDRLGPGAYLGHRSHEKSMGYAPFGCTDGLQVVKAGKADATNMTGPGSYDPKLPAAYDCGLPKREVPFGVSAPQRPPLAKKVKGPSPGEYEVEKKVPAPLQCRTMGAPQSDRKTTFRSTSAPSIPQFHQSFGYEEVGDGRLVRQGPRGGVTYLSGRGGDSAGPGHYEVPGMLRSNGNQFGRSERSGNAPKGAGEEPGPGHYISRSEQRGQVAKAPTVVSSFVSQSSARPSIKGAEAPGPGEYHAFRKVNPSLREQHAELQYFGSTVERFRDLEMSWDPGPGQYREMPKSLRPAMKPFCTSDTRFKRQAVMTAPGPGSYDPALESLTSGACGTVSILGAMGSMAFGSNEKKGSMVSKVNAPGPGHYHAQEPRGVEMDTKAGGRAPLRKKSLPSSTFKSNSNKAMPSKVVGPAPGAYDPMHAQDTCQIARMPGKSEGFLSTARQRVDVARSSSFPAPGSYDPGEITGGKKIDSFNRVMVEGVPQSGRPRSLGFAVSAQRFQEPKAKNKKPGPGAYENFGPGWITKTHNIYFGDLT